MLYGVSLSQYAISCVPLSVCYMVCPSLSMLYGVSLSQYAISCVPLSVCYMRVEVWTDWPEPLPLPHMLHSFQLQTVKYRRSAANIPRKSGADNKRVSELISGLSLLWDFAHNQQSAREEERKAEVSLGVVWAAKILWNVPTTCIHA